MLLIAVQQSSLLLRLRPGTMLGVQRSGVIFCLVSAAAFGGIGIFGKLAYGEGSTVGTLLSVRFVVAALLLWVLTAATGALAGLRRLPRRDVLAALALGAIGYGAQAGAYFLALDRMDASLLSLVLYTYPVIVTVAAIALGRDRASRRTTVALALACSGLVLVLAGAAAGALDPLGTGLAARRRGRLQHLHPRLDRGLRARRPARAQHARVHRRGVQPDARLARLRRPRSRRGERHRVRVARGLAVVSTVAAIGLFFAGLRLVGPTAASILSTLEPVVAVALAFAVFGESLGPAQLAGGALVLLAVLVVRAPQRRAAPATARTDTGRERDPRTWRKPEDGSEDGDAHRTR